MTKATNRFKKRQKFKLLKAARRRVQESLRCVTLGTDCSPGSDVISIIQI